MSRYRLGAEFSRVTDGNTLPQRALAAQSPSVLTLPPTPPPPPPTPREAGVPPYPGGAGKVLLWKNKI